MRKGKDLSHDLDRLVAATSMYARQQSERATFGDDEDYDDAKQDSHRVLTEVLDTLEKHLDEDFVEQLDRGGYPRLASSLCWPRMPEWSSTWPNWWSSYNVKRSRVAPRRYAPGSGRTHDMLDEILEDFRADFEDRLRKARRDDRAISDAELDESLNGLRQDLTVVVRRSRRREDRRDEEEESTRKETGRKSRSTQ